MTFTVTDKYYTSGKLGIDDLTIKMQNGQLDSSGNEIVYNLKNEPVTISLQAEELRESNVPITNTSGSITTASNQLIGHTYILKISNLEQLEMKSGLTTKDYSGIVTVAVAGDKIKDRGPAGNNVSQNGNTATKAISISLSDNGKFLASFSDYKIKKTDKFVRRSNDKPLNSTYIDKNENTNKISSIKNERKSVCKLSKKQIKKAEIATIRYYSKTIFTVNYIKFDKKGSAKLHGKKYKFIVNVSKEGIVQNPDRMIILKKNRKGIWKVTNEGY